MTLLEKAAHRPIEILIPYLGYGEKDNANDLTNMNTYGHSNYTFIAKYFDDLWNSGYKFYNTRKQTGEWCDMTVDYAMCQSFGPENARKVLYQPMESCGAGCYWSARYYRDNGAWIERSGNPRTGDQIFFGKKGDETHTGLVERVDTTYVYTIEGNTSDRLLRKSYARTSTKIAGYGRPRYEAVIYMFEEEEDMTKAETLQLFQDEFKKVVDELKPKELTRDDILKILKDQYIEDYSALPNWAKKEMRPILDKKYVDGGTDYEVNPDDINMFLSDIKSIIVAYRMCKDMLGNAEATPAEPIENLEEKVAEIIVKAFSKDEQ